jgi:hypothetical protein
MVCKNKTFESGFTVARLEALEAAIADGVTTVKYSDKEVTYRSLDEMLKVRKLMMGKLGLTKTCGAPGLFGGSRLTGKHSKGLC